MNNYIILRHRMPDKLAELVSEKISEGYIPLGSTFIVQGDEYSKGYEIEGIYYQGTPEIKSTFCQTLIKDCKVMI